MMYIDDCLNSLHQVMSAPRVSYLKVTYLVESSWLAKKNEVLELQHFIEFQTALSTRTYNVAAMSFTPAELFEAVKKHVPHLQITYKADARQKIGKMIFQMHILG